MFIPNKITEVILLPVSGALTLVGNLVAHSREMEKRIRTRRVMAEIKTV